MQGRRRRRCGRPVPTAASAAASCRCADGAAAGRRAAIPSIPANFGRLCSKGSALGETLGLDGRLLHPMIGDRRVGWDAALDAVATGFARVIDRHGPDAVAFYVSGQLLTEDYYVANKLMKGFIGCANIDTNSRLCMASSVAGHKRAFGADVVPGCYEDLDEADLIVLVGSNAAWCHPVLFQRMLRNRVGRGARIVNIDPRRTGTGEEADLQLSLRGGSDAILFNGLLVDLVRRGLHRPGLDRRAHRRLRRNPGDGAQASPPMSRRQRGPAACRPTTSSGFSPGSPRPTAP